jgi:ATP-dependent RNA helicase MSS116, mitochondrial
VCTNLFCLIFHSSPYILFPILKLYQTIAYLLPAIERLLQLDHKIFRPGRTIGIIIIAPTRELVIQLSQEATKLLTFHHGYTVQPLYGGISIQRDRAILFHRPIPTVLVSTPGRLYDLLRDAASFRVHGNRNLVDVVNECPIVIFDEADRLMEGFMTEINTISSYLPRIEKRQTMLFSATISSKLKQVLSTGHPKILPSDYVTVDCVNENDITTQTNQRVAQTYVQLSDMQLYVSGFLSIVESLMKKNNNKNSQSNTKKSKVILFLPTAKLVKFFTEVLNYISSISLSSTQSYDIYSIHSRMSQGSRNRASTQFRSSNSNNCILLSSDVSARGVDYPDVTFVVQVRKPYYDVPHD